MTTIKNPTLRILILFCFLCSFFPAISAAKGFVEENDSIGKVPIVFEAESGDLGSEYLIGQDGNITYIAPSKSHTSYSPRDTTKIATYMVTFADTGYYNLFARIYVGPGGYDDDSYFSAKAFGEKDVNITADWIPVNGLAVAGFSNTDGIVDKIGTVGSGIWKWVNVTNNFFPNYSTEKSFYVGSDTLTKTFQIGSREDGLFIDKLAFGKYDLYYTVNDLDSMLPGSTVWPGDSTMYYPGPPIADGSPKFLGNLMARGDENNFYKIWNQITPENEGKWASVGTSQDTTKWNWGGLDNLYNYAKSHNLIFKFHTLIWGGQQPSWINSLPPEQQLIYIESWIRQVGQRYPDIDLIDVVNEALPGHNPPDGQNDRANYKYALGGDGETGWDWVIKSFELARKYLPNAKLLINDYGIVNDVNATTQYINVIQLLNERGLIDGIGIQSHRFSIQNGSVETMKYNLDRMAATGLPIYPSEMDMGDNDDEAPFDDQLQLDTYKRVFPLFWEHPSVAGITIWGYKMPVWQETCHLVNDDGSWRPALKWLAQYVKDTPVEINLVKISESYLEPECGTVGDNWNVLTDESASNGHYVTAKDGFYSRNVAPTEEAAHIVIPFSVDTTGNYSIHARVKFPTSSSKVFWVKLDDGDFKYVTGDITSAWNWRSLTSTTLDKGDHTITIAYRDRGALLDKICISNSLLAPTGTGSIADNNCDITASVNNIREEEFIYNFPNPVTSSTTIKFGITKTANVNLKVLDIYGREVVTLVNEMLNDGVYEITWNAKNSNGSKLASGTYFYRLVNGNSIVTKKMLLK